MSSEDGTEKLNCLSICDESDGRSMNGGTKPGSSLDAPYLILCYGSGIGITLVYNGTVQYFSSSSNTTVNCAKTAELVDLGGPWKPCIVWGPESPGKSHFK